MMPASSFTAFQESPYLSKSAAAQGLVAQDLASAQELLNLASEKAKAAGDPADVTLAGYRSMYCSAKALVHHAGYEITNFRGLLIALEKLYTGDKKLDKTLTDQLVASQRLVGNAEDHLKAAGDFLAKARQLTGSKA